MRRRDFIGAVVGAAAIGPLAAAAQQPSRIRRVAVLSAFAEDDSEVRDNLQAFRQALEQLGWIVGRNVQIDCRSTSGEAERIRKYAAEVLALAPDVVLAAGGSMVRPIQQLSSSTPIVFVQNSDQFDGGLVDTLALAGRNTTGFTIDDFSIAAKWLELLRQISPNLVRIAVLHDTTNPAGIGFFDAVQSAAPPVGLEVSPASVRDASEIERGVTAFARRPNGGLIVVPNCLAIVHRELITALAAKHQLPAIYGFRLFVNGGGLVSYETDALEQFRQAAGYVHRILNGEEAADLPVRAPTKYTLAINLQTARMLGLAAPTTLFTALTSALA